MIYDYILRDRIVPLRGDYGLPNTHVRESFTESQLDAIAPLAPGDQNCLGESCRPSPETLKRLKLRIEMAKILKYGRQHKG